MLNSVERPEATAVRGSGGFHGRRVCFQNVRAAAVTNRKEKPLADPAPRARIMAEPTSDRRVEDDRHHHIISALARVEASLAYLFRRASPLPPQSYCRIRGAGCALQMPMFDRARSTARRGRGGRLRLALHHIILSPRGRSPPTRSALSK